MNGKEYIDRYEEALAASLATFLQAKGQMDENRPVASDIEEKWEAIAQSYIPDGAREFNGYPTVSLGWMAFIGMAVAQFWDTDWDKYSSVEDLYVTLRDVRGYDCMDEYICEDVLKLSSTDAQAVSNLVADTASLALRLLQKEGFEPGTADAFHAYMRTLHQLYIAGYSIWLKRLGYRMTPLG